MSSNEHPLLAVSDLTVGFRMYGKGVTQGIQQVISNLSLAVRPGEILAVVGSSGSGKSLLAHAILGILPGNATVTGAMTYDGAPLTSQRQAALRGGEIALIPQSVTYLDPLMQVSDQVRGGDNSPSMRRKQRRVFAELGLDSATEKLYPFQLSGGMARRVLFSTAVVGDARLIIADEPTPGIHADQAVAALQTLRQLADTGKAVVLITHDIDLALGVADGLAVFYAGTTVEQTPVADFIAGPDRLRHPYTTALWRALPQNGFTPIPGFQPAVGSGGPGCLFAPHCPQKSPQCEREIPPMRPVRGGTVRCYHGT